MTVQEEAKAYRKFRNEEALEYCRKQSMLEQMVGNETWKHYDTASKALEEVEQYRALGTVEGFQKALDSSLEYYIQMKEYKAKLQEYEAIGTVEELKEVLNFKKYFDALYGEGLEIANWHKNGDLEPFDSFYESALD